jgi:heterotetrameric sarcosine oxidase gamma subunit
VRGPQDPDPATAWGRDGPLIARLQPEEAVVIGPPGAIIDALLAALAPGPASEAIAIDLTHGALVIALEGPRLDEWLAHLVDAAALPRAAGRCCRCRFVDVPALLVRLAAERLWLVVDRALAPYVTDWLSFTHDAAFEAAA